MCVQRVSRPECDRMRGSSNHLQSRSSWYETQSATEDLDWYPCKWLSKSTQCSSHHTFWHQTSLYSDRWPSESLADTRWFHWLTDSRMCPCQDPRYRAASWFPNAESYICHPHHTIPPCASGTLPSNRARRFRSKYRDYSSISSRQDWTCRSLYRCTYEWIALWLLVRRLSAQWKSLTTLRG